MPNYDPALKSVLARIRLTDLANHLGINASAIPQWRRVPAKHARRVADLVGIPMAELRPDLFDAAGPGGGAA